jgi:hypothetical protein
MTFAERVIEVISRIAVRISQQLAEEWKAGHLRRGEYVAMLFPTVGAFELAKVFLTVTPAPLKDLRKDDLPEATAPAGGYCILLIALFWDLQQVMRNKPEVAQAIETPHADLIRRYSAIVGFEDRMFTERITRMDELTAAWDGDPRPAFEQTIIDFLQTMSVRGPRHKDKLEAMLFPAMFTGVMNDLVGNLQPVLENSAMTDQSEIIKTLLGHIHR